MEYLFNNKSQVKFFEGTNLVKLEKEINAFMLTVKKIYNVKHVAIVEEGYQNYNYIMVSYE